jgi:glyoxylase-like metal-dependent hydrolase (beta-lactamase superfamily II)
VPFTFSCYVIKHGSDYMVWDTGYLPGSTAERDEQADRRATRADECQARPGEVRRHQPLPRRPHGQLAPFANATLLIGKGDWDGVNANPPMGGANVAGFKEWMGTSRKVKPLTADEDVFGDGSVIVFRTPGHTPGHTALLVRLKEKGPVVLAGDAAHFHENYESNGVPGFNFDRAQTIASLERIKAIEKNLKATVIIQHDPRDIDKLPAFPNAAR